MRVGIGAAVFLAFWTYVLVLGRRAAAAGYTGAFGEHERLEREVPARQRTLTADRREPTTGGLRSGR